MGFLREASGGYSSARLIFIIGSIWAMAITSYLAVSDTDVPVLIAFFTAIEGVWIALKLGQKPMEQKK